MQLQPLQQKVLEFSSQRQILFLLDHAYAKNYYVWRIQDIWKGEEKKKQHSPFREHL